MGGVTADLYFQAIALLRSAITVEAVSTTPQVLSVAIRCASCIALLWAIWQLLNNSCSSSSNVPMLPGAKPVAGHAVQLLCNEHRLHDWILDNARLMTYRTFSFWVPTLPRFFVVTNAACLEYVLKDNHRNFLKGERFFNNFACLLGHGIFASDGDQWVWQRKLASTIFTVRSFKQYTNVVFAEKLQVLSARLGDAAASASPIDLHDLLYRFTLDSFGQLGFGVNPGCLSCQDKVPFALALDEAQMITNLRFYTPASPLVELLSGNRFKLARDCSVIRQYAADIVKLKRQQQHTAAATGTGPTPKADGDECVAKDLLSLFMEAVGPGGKPLSDRQLVDTVINFIIAGRDTTAQALSWTFYELLHHPEVEAKLLQELRDVLGPGCTAPGAAVKPTYDQIRALPYSRACFLEALRLHPSVPQDVKYAVKDDTLPDGSFIPKGGQILYSIYAVNRMEAFWGPDAADFRPGRWLELASMPSPYSYLSFNAGPRLCLGQRLAEIEGVYVLAGLLARFRLRQEVPGSKVNYRLSTTHPMKEGLRVLVEERG